MKVKENVKINKAYGIRNSEIIVTRPYINRIFGGDYNRALKVLDDWIELLEAILEEEHGYIS